MINGFKKQNYPGKNGKGKWTKISKEFSDESEKSPLKWGIVLVKQKRAQLFTKLAASAAFFQG
ncbi:MAG: hypothetical protein ACQEWF_22330 [Bacillota bacterium]